MSAVDDMLRKLDAISGPATGTFPSQMPEGYQHLAQQEILSKRYTLDRADIDIGTNRNLLGRFLRAYTSASPFPFPAFASEIELNLPFFLVQACQLRPSSSALPTSPAIAPMPTCYRADAGPLPDQLKYLFEVHRKRPFEGLPLQTPQLELLVLVLRGFISRGLFTHGELVSEMEKIDLMATLQHCAMGVALATATELVSMGNAILNLAGPLLRDSSTIDGIRSYVAPPGFYVLNTPDNPTDLTAVLKRVAQGMGKMKPQLKIMLDTIKTRTRSKPTTPTKLEAKDFETHLWAFSSRPHLCFSPALCRTMC
ncbi:hypothetical protein JCM1840_005606 [Sporobolomyces johnsonii]